MRAELWIAVLAVLGGAALGTVAWRARNAERAARLTAERSRARFAFLARVGELLERGPALDDLRVLTSLAVPEHADLCVLDLVEADGSFSVGAISASDPAAAEALAAMRAQAPPDPAGEHPVARVARSREATLLPAMSPAELQRYSASPQHLELMQRLGYRSVIVVPLVVQDRLVGVLSLIRLGAGPPAADYDEADLDLVREFARRAGLAIDHARIFGDLGAARTELQAIMTVLDESVMVFDRDERIVYANDAAAALHGVADPDELVRVGMPGMAERWETLAADGTPVDWHTLPGRRVLAGHAAEPVILQVVNRRTGERGWRRVKATAVHDPDGTPRLAVSVTEDVTQPYRRAAAQRFLAQAGAVLSSSLELDATLQQVASAAVPELGDWCAVDMPDERGRLTRVATADADPQRRARSGPVVRERSGDADLGLGPPQVMRTGRSELYAEIDEDVLRRAARDDAQLAALAEVGARSILVVPIAAGERVIGTITLGTAESGRRLDELDLELAEELGRRAAIVVENARVHAERTSVATTLQDALLPPRLPVIPGLVIAARFRAAGEASKVGGDFYDLFPLGGDWMVVMGDVSGKGPAAAAITSLARYTMRTAAAYEGAPSAVLARLNAALVAEDDDRSLCTAVCARVREGDDGATLITVARAGHPPPLLLGARSGTGAQPIGEAGTLLGAFPDGRWADTELRLGEGEALVLYTDGVTDTRGREDRFGAERLEHALAGLAGQPADAIASGLDEALLDFQHGDQRDDVALLVLASDPGTEPGAAAATLVGQGG